MKMKKLHKIALSFTLALTMLLCSIIPVQAAFPVSLIPEAVFTLEPSSSIIQSEVIGYVPGKASSLKSSNTSVATVKQTKDSIRGGYNLIVQLKKSGKTTVSFKYKSKTYKKTVTVHKYSNPISSITIGNKKVSPSIFNADRSVNLKYSTYAGKKAKVTFKLKKNWQFAKQYCYTDTNATVFRGFQVLSSSGFPVSVKNGSTINLKNKNGISLSLDLENKVTGQRQGLSILFTDATL